jgi:predicted 2-oxoglutarate/Fe(II)-dependent dioxygenase YbiX
MAVLQFNPNMAPDSAFVPGTLKHLVVGNRGRLMDPRRTPIRTDGERTLLFDLDTVIQRLAQDSPSHPSALQLVGMYHNLLRRWAEL